MPELLTKLCTTRELSELKISSKSFSSSWYYGLRVNRSTGYYGKKMTVVAATTVLIFYARPAASDLQCF